MNSTTLFLCRGVSIAPRKASVYGGDSGTHGRGLTLSRRRALCPMKTPLETFARMQSAKSNQNLQLRSGANSLLTDVCRSILHDYFDCRPGACARFCD
jgi:hypothetical protein